MWVGFLEMWIRLYATGLLGYSDSKPPLASMSELKGRVWLRTHLTASPCPCRADSKGRAPSKCNDPCDVVCVCLCGPRETGVWSQRAICPPRGLGVLTPTQRWWTRATPLSASVPVTAWASRPTQTARWHWENWVWNITAWHRVYIFKKHVGRYIFQLNALCRIKIADGCSQTSLRCVRTSKSFAFLNPKWVRSNILKVCIWSGCV